MLFQATGKSLCYGHPRKPNTAHFSLGFRLLPLPLANAPTSPGEPRGIPVWSGWRRPPPPSPGSAAPGPPQPSPFLSSTLYPRVPSRLLSQAGTLRGLGCEAGWPGAPQSGRRPAHPRSSQEYLEHFSRFLLNILLPPTNPLQTRAPSLYTHTHRAMCLEGAGPGTDPRSHTPCRLPVATPPITETLCYWAKVFCQTHFPYNE